MMQSYNIALPALHAQNTWFYFDESQKSFDTSNIKSFLIYILDEKWHIDASINNRLYLYILLRFQFVVNRCLIV